MNTNHDVWLQLHEDRAEALRKAIQSERTLRRTRPGERAWMARQAGHILQVLGERLVEMGRKVERPEVECPDLAPREMKTA